MNLTSNTSVVTKITAPTMPAMTTCTGVMFAMSSWLSTFLRTPKKDQNTVLNTRKSGVPAVFARSAGC